MIFLFGYDISATGIEGTRRAMDLAGYFQNRKMSTLLA